MCEALEQRVSELERILGLSFVSDAQPVHLDVHPIKKHLKNLKLDFIMDVPIAKLQRLRSVFNEDVDVPLKDKIRSVNFSSGLMRRRAELLEEVKKCSELVFESSAFDTAEKCSLQLTKIGADIHDAYKTIFSFEEECSEFFNDLQAVLAETRSRIEDSERIIKTIKNKKSSKAQTHNV